jgi:hypothetical protein
MNVSYCSNIVDEMGEHVAATRAVLSPAIRAILMQKSCQEEKNRIAPYHEAEYHQKRCSGPAPIRFFDRHKKAAHSLAAVRGVSGGPWQGPMDAGSSREPLYSYTGRRVTDLDEARGRRKI